MRLPSLFGRLLSGPGKGFWISGRKPEHALYLLLFGSAGEAVSRSLPDRAWLAERASGNDREPRLLIFTDRGGVAEWAQRAGHIAVRLDAPPGLPSYRRVRWLMTAVKAQLAFFRPRAILWSPIQPAMLDWACRFSAELRRTVPLTGNLPTPTILAPEMTIDTVTLRKFVDRSALGESKPLPLRLFWFGNPDFFDYGEHLAGIPPLEPPVCLGWRRPVPDPIRLPPAAEPEIYLWIRDPQARRELAGRLSGDAAVRARYGRVLAYEDGSAPRAGSYAPEHALSEPSLRRFLDRADGSPGLIVADGDAEATLLSNIRCRAVVVRSLSNSPAALFRCSYAIGCKNLPVFDRQSDLLAALASGEADVARAFEWPELLGEHDAWEGFARHVVDAAMKSR